MNEIIFDDKMFFISRDVILSVANQDGGAHVDPILNESYSNITKRNSLGYYQVSNAVKRHQLIIQHMLQFVKLLMKSSTLSIRSRDHSKEKHILKENLR